MTWQELADFINDEMPECNKDEEATVWDSGNSGNFYHILDISPYDTYESANEYNFYSIDINTDDGSDPCDVDAVYCANKIG